MASKHRSFSAREQLLEPGYGVDRRALLGGGLALGLPLLFPRSLRAAQGEAAPRPLKVGLVGCGGRGTGAAWQAMHAEAGGVVLWAMGDVFADRLESSRSYLEGALLEEGNSARMDVPEERRFTGFDSFRAVIDSGVDIVLLTAIPAFRPAHITYAVEKGCHVFCEKPMAVDVPGLRRVEAAAARAKEKGLSLVSGYCWRYNERHRELFQRVHSGAIGDLQAVYTNYYAGPLGTRPRQEGWSDTEWIVRNWHHFRWLSGDHLVEQAIHSVDKQSWAFADRAPLRAIAVGGCQTRKGSEKGDTFDHFAVVYEYEGGARAFCNARQWPNSYGENNDFLYGSKGRATIENWAPYHAIETYGGDTWVYEGEGNDMYQQELDELVASIRAGKPVNDGVWMCRSNLLGILGREAAYTGRAITWEEILNSERKLGPPGMDDGVLEFGALAHSFDEPVPGEYKLL